MPNKTETIKGLGPRHYYLSGPASKEIKKLMKAWGLDRDVISVTTGIAVSRVKSILHHDSAPSPMESMALGALFHLPDDYFYLKWQRWRFIQQSKKISRDHPRARDVALKRGKLLREAVVRERGRLPSVVDPYVAALEQHFQDYPCPSQTG
jgi:hypothetical protein